MYRIWRDATRQIFGIIIMYRLLNDLPFIIFESRRSIGRVESHESIFQSLDKIEIFSNLN